MTHIRLFGRNLSPEFTGVSHPRLYVEGTLPNAQPSLSYEGRLQIKNNFGDCTVQLIAGTLPTGYSIWVDNTTSQVVIGWPDYSTGLAPIQNGNFDSASGWNMTDGWSRVPTYGGTGSFVDFNGESWMKQTALIPYTADEDSFEASINIQQGGSSAGNLGCAVSILFYDINRVLIEEQRGPEIWSGKNGAWHESFSTFAAPAGTEFVQYAVWANRRSENKALWVDTAWWTLQSTVGINGSAEFPITIRVRDQARKTAEWTGTVRVTDSDIGGTVLGPFTLASGSIGYQTGDIAYSSISSLYHIFRNGRHTSPDGVTWTTKDPSSSIFGGHVNTDTGGVAALTSASTLYEEIGSPEAFVLISSNTASTQRTLRYGGGNFIATYNYPSAGHSGPWTGNPSATGLGLNYQAGNPVWIDHANCWIWPANSGKLYRAGPTGLGWVDTGATASFSINDTSAYSPLARCACFANTSASGGQVWLTRTTDGVTFTDITLPPVFSVGYNTAYRSMLYVPAIGRFVYITEKGLYTSRDGITWTPKPAFIAGLLTWIAAWHCCAVGPDRIVITNAASAWYIPLIL